MSKGYLITYGADFANAKIASFENKTVAAEAAFQSTSTGKLVVQSEDDLSSLGGPELVALYNSLNGGEAINKFRDLATGRSRTIAIIKGLSESGDPALKSSKADDKPVRKSAESRKGKNYGKLELAKKIHLLKPNPRRPGTAGHKSFALMTEGMTIGEFLEAGGRRVDLKWDIAKKNVELMDA